MKETAHLSGAAKKETTGLEFDLVDSDLEEVESQDTTSDNDSVEEADNTDSEMDIDVVAGKPGELGTLAQQAKIARKELQSTYPSEDESEEDEETDNRPKWGSKKQFYGTDRMDGQKEAEVDDLEETLRLQRTQLEQLRDADFAIPDASIPLPHLKDTVPSEGISDDTNELQKLYMDLKQSMDEIRYTLSPLLEEARKGDLCTNEGLTYLEAKHLLLLHYCICLTFYLLLKLEGTPVADHPVVLRLIEIRTYLEKIRPLEARLQPQVEKLLKAAVMKAEEEEGPSISSTLRFQLALETDGLASLAPHPETLIPKVMEGAQTYKPPKMHPVMMDDLSSKRKRKEKTIKKGDDAIVTEIVREMTGAPEELTTGWTPQEKMRSILSKRLDSSALEGELYTRSTKTDRKHGLKNKDRELFGGVQLDALMDDVQEIVRNTQAANILSDANQKPASPLDIDSEFQPTEIMHAHTAAPLTKRQRKSKMPLSFPPKGPKLTSGRRGLSSEIQRNRGLTPHRPRERKNPRRRHRLQFENKEKRRKGQHLTPTAAPDRYGGEVSGISKVKKSIKFG